MAVIAQPHRPRDGRPPVILLVFANDRFADGSGYLRNLPVERRAIQDVMAPAVRDGFCTLVIEQNVTHERLYDLFDAHDGHIVGVHFAGHADPEGLKLEDAYGRPVASQMDGLAVRLSNLPMLRWVFLNGCGTSAHVAALHSQVKLPVIATETAIRDDIAVQFARRFYSGMANGQTIGESFENAESGMHSQHVSPSNTVRSERPPTERYFSEITHASAHFRMLRPSGQALAWPWVMALPPDLHGTEQFPLIRSPRTSTMVPATPGSTLTGRPNSVPPSDLGSTTDPYDDATLQRPHSFPPIGRPPITRPPPLPPDDPTTVERLPSHPPASGSSPVLDLESTLVTGPGTLSLDTRDLIALPTISGDGAETLGDPGPSGGLDPSHAPSLDTPPDRLIEPHTFHPPYAPTQAITRLAGDRTAERRDARKRRLLLALIAGIASALLVVLGGLGMRVYDDLKDVERLPKTDGRGSSIVDGGSTPPDGSAQPDQGGATAAAPTPDSTPPRDSTPPPDATTRPDAAPEAAAPMARSAMRDVAALRAAVERDVSRCSCIAARTGAAELSAAGQPVPAGVRTYCARPEKGQAAGRCAATLERKLNSALDACRCDGDSRRLVTQLKLHFGIDRSKIRHDRCFVPGLPRTCVSPR